MTRPTGSAPSAPSAGVDDRAVHSVHHAEEVMGTVVTIDLYTDPSLGAADLAPGVERACRVLHHADAVFSTWDASSPMSRLRRDEITPAEAPPEVTEVLGLCARARELSGGWFDPWALPGGVDPTGYVKGWAAQRALDTLRAPGIVGAVVNAAGDIASRGGVGRSQPFRFGIVDPSERGRIVAVVETGAALATSGTYERGDHLFDPHSGRAVAAVASASVTGPDLGLADALATALAVAGDPGLALVDAVEGYAGMIVDRHGAMRWTPAFPLADRRA